MTVLIMIKKTDRIRKFETLMGEEGKVFRISEAMLKGIHSSMIYKLRDSGEITQLSRGIYQVNDNNSFSNTDFAVVAVKSSAAVVCLISALSFHGLTTQIPHSVSIAIRQGARAPKIDFPPISVHRFSEVSYNAGIETHKDADIEFKIYGPEKTIADCFKFRNKIGMDIVLEALKLYKKSKKVNIPLLTKYAKICRVDKVMKPYIEASI